MVIVAVFATREDRDKHDLSLFVRQGKAWSREGFHQTIAKLLGEDAKWLWYFTPQGEPFRTQQKAIDALPLPVPPIYRSRIERGRAIFK